MFKSEQLAIWLDYEVSAPKQDEDIKGFLWHYVDILSPRTNIINTNSIADLNRIIPDEYDSIVNLSKINNTNRITRFLNKINEKLETGGTFILCAETLEQRKNRLFSKYSSPLFYPYYICDFILNRVMPKLLLTRKIYYFFRRGNNRILSLPEMLGRIVFSGFKIVDSKIIDGLTYFIVKKEKEPIKVDPPADGMLLKIKKIGKGGKPITIYKLRTMFTFSQYIQKLVYENNHLQEGGKFKNDFRVTGWGKVLRKYWLDEFPMFFNILKGDLKLVGVRPLTEQYLSLYNKDLVNKRVMIKPGLIPPFYVDMPHTLSEIMESEERYIEAYLKHPYITDMKYFYHAVVNIIFKGARSC